MQAFPPINQISDFQLLVDSKPDLVEPDEAEVSDLNVFALLVGSHVGVQIAATKTLGELKQATPGNDLPAIEQLTSSAVHPALFANGDSQSDQSLIPIAAGPMSGASLDSEALPTKQANYPTLPSSAFAETVTEPSITEIVIPDAADALKKQQSSSADPVFSLLNGREESAAKSVAEGLQDAIPSLADKPQESSLTSTSYQRPASNSTFEGSFFQQVSTLNSEGSSNIAETQSAVAGAAYSLTTEGVAANESLAGSLVLDPSTDISSATSAAFQSGNPGGSFSFDHTRGQQNTGSSTDTEIQSPNVASDLQAPTIASQSVEELGSGDQTTAGTQSFAAQSTVVNANRNNRSQDEIDQPDSPDAVVDMKAAKDQSGKATVGANTKPQQAFVDQADFASAIRGIEFGKATPVRRSNFAADGFQTLPISESSSHALQGEASGLPLQQSVPDAAAGVQSFGIPSATRSSQLQTIQTIVNELVAEGAAHVDGKTMTVRFEEPHIGSVQLEITQTDSGMSVSVAAGDELTLEMLNSNAQQFERSLKDNQIELLEIVSLQMNTATSDQGHPSETAHREMGATYRSNQSSGSNTTTTTESNQESTTTLNFRA